jgi:hypothetical protein
MLNFKKKFTASIAFAVVSLGSASAEHDSAPFSFGLFGDMPYTSTTLPDAEARYQRLIADMNTHDLAFGVHVGDIKAGNTRCDDVVYSRNLELFNTFRAPILFTPGDNEWTDCHRLNNGNHAPLGRLDLIRSTFFSSNQSLGQYPIPVRRQHRYPENASIVHGKVLVITLHMPGSNNNREQKISELVSGVPRPNPYYDNDVEFKARNKANIEWLRMHLAFAAVHPAIKGVVIAIQGNPFDRFLEPVSSSNNNVYVRSGFEDFVTDLRALTRILGFLGKKVVLAHGDTHIMKIGQPLTTTYPGCDPAVTTSCVAVPVGGTVLTNFTRVEVFGQNNVHWIKVNVDKSDPNLFSFQPMIVTGN